MRPIVEATDTKREYMIGDGGISEFVSVASLVDERTEAVQCQCLCQQLHSTTWILSKGIWSRWLRAIGAQTKQIGII